MIGIVIATALEANPLIAKMQLELLEEKPFRIFSKENYVLIISGIGKINAALATGYLAEKFKTHIILNIGAAGALNAHYQLGDVYHISNVIEADKPSLLTKKIHVESAYILNGFPTAVLATQDIPVIDIEKRKALSAIADLADMEGAAIHLAAKKFNIPCYIFKIVSDTALHTDDATIVKNIAQCADHLANYVVEKVLKAIPKSIENIPIDNP